MCLVPDIQEGRRDTVQEQRQLLYLSLLVRVSTKWQILTKNFGFWLGHLTFDRDLFTPRCIHTYKWKLVLAYLSSSDSDGSDVCSSRHGFNCEPKSSADCWFICPCVFLTLSERTVIKKKRVDVGVSRCCFHKASQWPNKSPWCRNTLTYVK